MSPLPKLATVDNVIASIAVSTFVASVTSAPASIPSSFVWSASVNAFVSALFSYAVLISASLWSAVAHVSIHASFVFSASVYAFVSNSASYATLISAPVWSAVALASAGQFNKFNALIAPSCCVTLLSAILASANVQLVMSDVACACPTAEIQASASVWFFHSVEAESY